jgi:hypothetical protein
LPWRWNFQNGHLSRKPAQNTVKIGILSWFVSFVVHDLQRYHCQRIFFLLSLLDLIYPFCQYWCESRWIGAGMEGVLTNV